MHPPVAPDGRISTKVTFPSPGPYKVVIDVYPKPTGPASLVNYQLFTNITVAGTYVPKPLPPFSPTQTVDGYRFVLHGDAAPEGDRPGAARLHGHRRRTGSRRRSRRGSARSRTRSSSGRDRSTTSTPTSARPASPAARQHPRRDEGDGHIDDAGAPEGRRARPRAGHLAAVPPDPGRRTDPDGAVHAEGVVTRGAALVCAVAVAGASLRARGAGARRRRSGERLPDHAAGVLPVRREVLAGAGGAAPRRRERGEEAGLPDQGRADPEQLRPRLGHVAVAEAAAVRALPRRGGRDVLQAAAADRHAERVRLLPPGPHRDGRVRGARDDSDPAGRQRSRARGARRRDRSSPPRTGSTSRRRRT